MPPDVWLLARGVARGLAMAGAFGVFATMLLAAWLLPEGARVRGLVVASLLLALAGGALWFALQTADMAGAGDWRDLRAAIPVVAGQTRFGALLIGRSAALVVAVAWFLARGRRGPAVVAGGAVGAEAWLDHGGAMRGGVGDFLLVSAILHLLAGGAWLGALPGLRRAVTRLPLGQAADVARRFSPLGIVCVGTLVATGAAQGIVLVGSLRALVATGYGEVVLAKTIGLGALVVLAALNRRRFVPALAGDKAGDKAGRRALARSITAEIAIGLAVLLAAGLLLNLAPPTMVAMSRQEGGS